MLSHSPCPSKESCVGLGSTLSVVVVVVCGRSATAEMTNLELTLTTFSDAFEASSASVLVSVVVGG